MSIISLLQFSHIRAQNVRLSAIASLRFKMLKKPLTSHLTDQRQSQHNIKTHLFRHKHVKALEKK